MNEYTHYSYNLSPFRRIIRVFSPSLTSVLVGTLLTVLLLGGKIVQFLPGSEQLYGYVNGEDGILSLIGTSDSMISTYYQQLVSASWSYVAVVIIIALLMGAFVFLFTRILNQALYGLASTWHTWNSDPHLNSKGLRVIARTLLVRIGMTLLWLGFWYVTIMIIWPFCVLAVSVGVERYPSVDAFLFIGFYGVGLFALTLHTHVVFLRLIALRVRLIGYGG